VLFIYNFFYNKIKSRLTHLHNKQIYPHFNNR